MEHSLLQAALFLLIYLLSISLASIFLGGVIASFIKILCGVDDQVVNIVCKIFLFTVFLYFMGGYIGGELGKFTFEIWSSSSNYY